jgi:hypothetical protein
MGKIYQCTIRPFDCKYYTAERHRCGNDDGNAIEICHYAKEMPVEPELDDIGREILKNLRILGATSSGFMYDPQVKDEVEEEGKRITKVFEYVLNQEKNKEQKTEVVDMNTNHEFPKHIAEVLEALKFEKKELRYYGKAQNYHIKDAIIEFGIDGDSLLCRDVTSMKPLFIINSNIGAGYFISLLQAYYIIHARYIYERVEGIAEDFIEQQEN